MQTHSQPQGIDEDLLHPLFASQEGDVVLSAKGGTLFRLHSFVLKTTSGWFRAMFSLPQKHTPTCPTVLYLDEDEHTLEALFRMMCGLPILSLNSYDTVDSLLFAAEKYDMTGPASIIRHLVMTPPLADQPLRLYAVACRYGWVEEAKAASSQTLKYDLHLPEYRSSLERLAADAILDLFNFHRTRREVLKDRLNKSPFVSGVSVFCVECGWKIDYHTWRALKYRIILEMDARPLGDTIVDPGLEDWEEAKACWTAKCPNPGCDRTLYDRCETVRVINECIAQLPSSI
jgi:hypothetical protein